MAPNGNSWITKTATNLPEIAKVPNQGKIVLRLQIATKYHTQ